MVLVRYTFQGKLVLTGALHIGSGGGGSIGGDAPITDATVVRDSSGRAYIPGSSLRGVLRTAIGTYAPALFATGEDEVLFDDDEEREKGLRAKIEALGQETTEEHVQQRLDEWLTPAERLFGTVFWASPLHIPDLYPTREIVAAGEVRHGVGIDRDTGAARDQVKYDFEVLPKGHTFELFMRCEMPETYEKDWNKLLALGLRLLEQGELNLGGRLARGVGQVELRDLKVYRLQLDRAGLRKALLGEGTTRYGDSQAEGWARNILEAV
jgi:CRISPR-associated RAMP protein (TIGR02581 family)